MRLIARPCLLLSLLVLTFASARAEDLVLGLPRYRIEEKLGRPEAIRLERNGIRCWTYVLERDLHSRRELVRLIVLHRDRLLEDTTVRSEEVRFRCSSAAERWDRERSRPLVCNARWSRSC